MPTEEELRKQQEQSQQNTVAPEAQQPVQQTAPAVTSTQPTVQTTEPEPQWLGQVGAANTVNSALDFNPGANYINTPLADEHSLPLQILGNNQVHFLQKDKRTPQQTASIAKFLNKAYGTKIPEDGSRNSEMEITKVYNANLDTIPESLYRQGYIAGKPETKEEKTQKLLKEAVEKGRSFLDIYNIANEPPVYDRPRANRIDQNSKASVVADVLKLIGEGVTTKRGGTPITRQTIVPQLNAELQRLNDTYKQEVHAYKKGGFNALLMDEQEKRRSAALDAAREAAIQQIKIKADIEQRQREKQEQSELNKIKTQHELDMQRDKVNNEAKVKTANISASGRKNSGSTTTNERGDILIDGNIVKPKQAYVNHVAAKVKSEAKATDPVMGMSATEVFAANWNKYFDYVNGEFVPKGTAPATTTGATSRASSNNTQPKSRAK